MSVDVNAYIRFALQGAEQKRTRARPWTPEEDAFLIANLGYLTDAQIGKALKRTAVGVHLRWDRDLALPGPSKDSKIITAQKAADALGIDAHKIIGWCDHGLIPHRIMAGGRNIRLIDRQAFRRWVLNPMNWPYFKSDQVRDPELKRMLKKRAQRWGDEWWSSRQVADYHGADTQDVKRYIVLGRITSFRLPYSLGGRDWNRRWSNHFVLKSEAIQVTFLRGKGNHRPSQFTPAADAWLLKARDELGMTFVHIGRTMKIGSEKYNKKTGTAMSNPTISYRYKQLKAREAVRQSKTRRRGK